MYSQVGQQVNSQQQESYTHEEGRKAKRNNTTHVSIYTNEEHTQHKAAELKSAPPQEVHAAESRDSTAPRKSSRRNDNTRTADLDTIPAQASQVGNRAPPHEADTEQE